MVRLGTKIIFWSIISLLALCKLWLIIDNPIVPIYAPHDNYWFIRIGNFLMDGNWFGPYDHMTLIRPPVYPVWIWLSGITGIPLRINHEILVIISLFVLTFALIKNGINKWVVLLIYLLILFHPIIIRINDFVQSEVLYGPLMTLMISFMILLWSEKKPKLRILFLVLLAISMALLWHTRHETFMLIIYLILFVGIDWLHQKSYKKSKNKIYKREILNIGIPLGCILIFTLTFNALNYIHYDVFETSEVYSKSFLGANKALAKIKTGNKRRYVNVSTEAREKAYRNSPTFKQIKKILEEGAIYRGWVKHGCQNAGICNDFINGIFIWAFRDSVAMAGLTQSSPQGRSTYNRISQEIFQACQDGRIECENKLSSYFSILFPDGNLKPSIWINSFIKIFSFLNESEFPPSYQYIQNPGGQFEIDYDKVVKPKEIAKYKAGKIEKISISGWVYSDVNPIIHVSLANPEGHDFQQTMVWQNRVDVLQSLPENKRGGQNPNLGFKIQGTSQKGQLNSIVINFTTSDNTILTFQPRLGNLSKSPLIFIDNITREGVPVFFDLQKQFSKFYTFLIPLLFYSAFLSIPVLIYLLLKGAKRWDLAFTLGAFLLVIILSRVLLFTVFDLVAAILDRIHIRYVYPVMPLYITVLVLLPYLIFKKQNKEFRVS